MAKAFSKLAKVAEFQFFTNCITSKINGRIKQICRNQIEKLHILYTHPERGKWFERKSTVSHREGERVHSIPCSFS